MFFNAILALILRTLLARENQKLDKKHGTIAEQKANGTSAHVPSTTKNEVEASAGSENYGPKYRYVL